MDTNHTPMRDRDNYGPEDEGPDDGELELGLTHSAQDNCRQEQYYADLGGPFECDE